MPSVLSAERSHRPALSPEGYGSFGELMPIRPLIATAVFAFSLLLTVPSESQTPPKCAVTCSPDPNSTTYTGGTFLARPAIQNMRGRGSVLAPPIRRGR